MTPQRPVTIRKKICTRFLRSVAHARLESVWFPRPGGLCIGRVFSERGHANSETRPYCGLAEAHVAALDLVDLADIASSDAGSDPRDLRKTCCSRGGARG